MPTKVVTWGHPAFGGHSATVQKQLSNVQHIQATQGAFAAVLENKCVVTWGDPDFGGDSSAVKEQLQNVQHIQGTSSAFAAILDNGHVVTWGDPKAGGDSSAVQQQLMNSQVERTLAAHSSCRKRNGVLNGMS